MASINPVWVEGHPNSLLHMNEPSNPSPSPPSRQLHATQPWPAAPITSSPSAAHPLAPASAVTSAHEHDPPTTSADGLKPISTPAMIQPSTIKLHRPPHAASVHAPSRQHQRPRSNNP
ncbi:hypothetical protein ACLOJK_040982 [Asimina triloba]